MRKLTDEDIMNMSDAELRELCEDANEKIELILATIENSAAIGGIVACPRCSANASWQRSGPNWTVKCSICIWDAAGYIGRLNRQ